MNKAGGFITLHRQIMDWEWYKHPHTAFLFIHLLLSANFTDGNFKGTIIKRGQLVRSIPQLSTDTGLSIQTVKTALAHLRLTGEITDDTNRQYRIITITKYDDYQNVTDKLTANQPSTNRRHNRQLTDECSTDQPQYNNITNNKGINKQGNNNSLSVAADTFRVFWEEYPKKMAKQDAIKEWKKLCPGNDELKVILDGLRKWKNSYEWQKEDGRYIPHASTWLHGRRWEDEVPVDRAPAPRPAPARPVTAQQYTQRDYSNEQKEAMARMIAMFGGGDE